MYRPINLLVFFSFACCLISISHASLFDSAEDRAKPSELQALFFKAASEGSDDILRDLLQKGVDVNAREKYGTPALHLASQAGHGECVKIFIEANANVNARNSIDSTALHRAACYGHLPCIKALTAANAEVDARDKYGMTALRDASGNGYLDCIKDLIEAKADVNVRNDSGNTALHLTSRGRADCVKELIKYSYQFMLSESVIFYARRRIFNVLLQFVWLRNHNPQLENFKSESLQHEILSRNEGLQEDLVLILLDELKKGREIKGVALIRSKEAAVSYLLKQVKEIVSQERVSNQDDPLFPSWRIRVVPLPEEAVEYFRSLIREGLTERIEVLKDKNRPKA